MAEYSNIEKGQTPAICQLCDKSSRIKWKCLDCDFLLCKECKVIHLKVTDTHEIVDLKQASVKKRNPSIGLDFGHIKCKQHPGQMCCLYCIDCGKVVCPLCFSETHKEHNTTDIGKGYQRSLASMKTYTSELEQDMVKLGTDLSCIEYIHSTEKSKHEDTRKKILQQDQILKELVDKYTTELLEKEDQQWIKFHQSMTNEETSVRQVTMEIESKIQKITKAIESNNVIEVFEAVKELTEGNIYQDLDTVKTTHQKMQEFKPREITLQTIESIFGDFQSSKENVQFEVEEKHTISLPLAENIMCSTDGSIWINSYSSKLLQNLNISNKEVKINKNIDYQVFSLTLTNMGKLIVSILQSALYILDRKTGKFKLSPYDISPLQSIGVHATKNNNILVGAREIGPTFPVNGPRQLIKMNEKGKKVKIYEFDDNGERLFTLPRKIVTDSEHNIYVSDIISQELSGIIVILQKRGGFKIYEGIPEINREYSFSPNNLAITQLDNVIATDEPNNTLHIINSEGHCLKYIKTKLLGISRPIAVDIDSRGKLYIGCNNHERGKERAKIYVVKFSEL